MPVETVEIKVVKVHRLTQDSHLKAFVDLEINDVLLIKGVRVIDGKNGIFVAMPTQLGKNDRWYEQVRCLNRGLSSQISQKVLEAYRG